MNTMIIFAIVLVCFSFLFVINMVLPVLQEERMKHSGVYRCNINVPELGFSFGMLLWLVVSGVYILLAKLFFGGISLLGMLITCSIWSILRMFLLEMAFKADEKRADRIRRERSDEFFRNLDIFNSNGRL